MRNTLRRALVLVVVVVAATGFAGSAAQAHDQLVSSSPAAGAKLTAAPRQVVLTFNEKVQEPAYAAVQIGDTTGKEVKATVQGDVNLVVDTSGMPATEAGQPSPWKVSFRIVSADGHPVNGDISFTVTPKTGPTSATTTTSSASTSGGGSGGGSTPWIWIGVGVLVVAVAGGSAVLARGRRA